MVDVVEYETVEGEEESGDENRNFEREYRAWKEVAEFGRIQLQKE